MKMLGNIRALILCGACLPLVLVFAPEGRAQSTANLLDSWRMHMNVRLEIDLARVAAAASRGALPPAIGVRLEEDATEVPANLFLPPPVRRKEPWLWTVAQILQSKGLPLGLLGVAAVESGFDPEALSPKGALGLWQLMPQTARRFGLAVNARRDDRLDPVKSTYAAASYLKDLYAQFGDWPLALAAYNAGEDRVQQALDRHGARDFWTLSRRSALPEETRRYVPVVLAEMKRTTPVPSFIPDDSRHAGLKPVSQAVRKVSAPATIVFATPSAAPGTLTPADR